MSTIDTVAAGEPASRRPAPAKVTVYHNDEARFMPYEDGHLLTAVTGHWLDIPADGDDLVAIGEWVFQTFNADLDQLETWRRHAGGGTAFLAACVYRLLGHRSLSVGDVIHVQTGQGSRWLACEPVGWRLITSRLTGPAIRCPRPASTSTLPTGEPRAAASAQPCQGVVVGLPARTTNIQKGPVNRRERR
ncbi:hypothetical protein [Phytohabitans kaempferiae]|uniref:Uncharacterized protein n=1 Tax=Phytohabitans kaempferiae TaxID=1620943 RepID=A0ABV6LY41_9ACTN